MKNRFLIFIALLCSCALGYFFYNSMNQDLHELYEIVKIKEQEEALNLVVVKEVKLKAIKEVTQPATLFKGAVYKTTGYNLTGLIINNSKIASCKDIVLELSYVADSGSIISTETVTIFKNVSAMQSDSFSIPVTRPNQTKSISFKLVKVN